MQSMNDRWTRDRERWNDPDQIRVARRFRHHVRTPKNPNGRIHREQCFNRAVCGHDVPGEFHHLDYESPFRGVWVCFSCHRKVDHGALAVPERAVWDYSSLVCSKPGTWVAHSREAGPPEVPGEVPF